jgi:hypothetical protein
MQTSQGRCEEALANIDLAHAGQVRIHGMVPPNVSRSNANLALNRVYCLRRLGRPAEADDLLSLIREYVATLRDNADRGYYKVDAKPRILDGDIGGALDVLEAAFRRNELGWTARYDALLRTLGDEPRFRALFAEMDSRIDALRAALDMPPAAS